MKVSLRKASAIVNELQEEFNNLEVVTTYKLSEFVDPVQGINAAREHLNVTLDRKKDLLVKIHEIRKAVGEANQTSGINKILTDLALTNKSIELVSSLGSNTMPAEAEINGMISKMKNSTETAYRYGINESTTISVLNKDDVEEINKNMKTLKKMKQELQDKLLHLNVSTEIEIGEIG